VISGAHAIIYSTDAEADRAFLRDVLALPHVDVGEGWLIFGLPPSEVAVHPSEENDTHELYFIADDIQAFAAAMGRRGIDCGPLQDQGWGILTQVTLPGGGKIGVYQPRHARPPSARVTKSVAVRSLRRTVESATKRKPTTRPARAAKRKPAEKKMRRR
jgi:hypothetical protein